MDDDSQNSRDTTLIFSLMLSMAAVFLLVRQLGRPDLALSSWIPLMGGACIIRVRWDLTSELWFWITILLVGLLHVPLIFLVPFPRMIVNKATLMPIGLVDFVIFYSSVFLVEKLIDKVPPNESQ